MILARIVLLFNVLVYAYLGILAIVDPVGFTETVSFGLLNGNSYIETSAMYGGLELGFALFFLFSVLSAKRMEMGLWGSVFIYLGLGAGRLLGILRYEASDLNFMLILLGSEVLMLALSLVALRLISNKRV